VSQELQIPQQYKASRFYPKDSSSIKLSQEFSNSNKNDDDDDDDDGNGNT
jgi:hypothetical protein